MVKNFLKHLKLKLLQYFEAAVKSKISKIRKQIREESKKEQDERIESMQEEMTENMDKYLSYVTKEWMEEINFQLKLVFVTKSPKVLFLV